MGQGCPEGRPWPLVHLTNRPRFVVARRRGLAAFFSFSESEDPNMTGRWLTVLFFVLGLILHPVPLPAASTSPDGLSLLNFKVSPSSGQVRVGQKVRVKFTLKNDSGGDLKLGRGLFINARWNPPGQNQRKHYDFKSAGLVIRKGKRVSYVGQFTPTTRGPWKLGPGYELNPRRQPWELYPVTVN